MKKVDLGSGNVLHLGDKVFWLKSEFEIKKIYRDKLGVVILELDNDERDPFHDYGRVIVPASKVSKTHKNRYDKKN